MASLIANMMSGKGGANASDMSGMLSKLMGNSAMGGGAPLAAMVASMLNQKTIKNPKVLFPSKAYLTKQ